MFLKISEFKKAMKSALKTTGGLYVGNLDDHYLVYASSWGVYVESMYATNKFKAAIMELIGDISLCRSTGIRRGTRLLKCTMTLRMLCMVW